MSAARRTHPQRRSRKAGTGQVLIDVTAMRTGEAVMITKPPAEGAPPHWWPLFQVADYIIELDDDGHATLTVTGMGGDL